MLHHHHHHHTSLLLHRLNEMPSPFVDGAVATHSLAQVGLTYIILSLLSSRLFGQFTHLNSESKTAEWSKVICATFPSVSPLQIFTLQHQTSKQNHRGNFGQPIQELHRHSDYHHTSR